MVTKKIISMTLLLSSGFGYAVSQPGVTITFPHTLTKVIVPNGNNPITRAKTDTIVNFIDFDAAQAGNPWTDERNQLIKNAAGPELTLWLEKEIDSCGRNKDDKGCMLLSWQKISPAFALEKHSPIKYIAHKIVNKNEMNEGVFQNIRDLFDYIADSRVPAWVKEEFPHFHAKRIKTVALTGLTTENAAPVAKAIGFFLHNSPRSLTEIHFILNETERDAYIKALEQMSEAMTEDPQYFEKNES